MIVYVGANTVHQAIYWALTSQAEVGELVKLRGEALALVTGRAAPGPASEASARHECVPVPADQPTLSPWTRSSSIPAPC